MTVAVIIVNWNGGPYLKRCLEAVARQQHQPNQVVVVDNASSDDSLSIAELDLNSVQLIRSGANVGFARANNDALKATRHCDLLALLNPDAFPEPGWLQALMAAAESADPGIAAFASQIRLAGDPLLLDGAGDSFHVSGRAWRNRHGTPVLQGPRDPMEVFAPCAAAALYRREAIESVGGFDERFFCYFEDVDLGFRLRLRGYRSMYVPTAIVDHISSGTSGFRSDFAVYHGERNMVWTYTKNMPGFLLWWYLPQHLVLNIAALMYYPLRGQGRAAWRAKIDALKGLPRVFRQRRAIQRERAVDIGTIRRSLRRGLLTPYVGRYT